MKTNLKNRSRLEIVDRFQSCSCLQYQCCDDGQLSLDLLLELVPLALTRRRPDLSRLPAQLVQEVDHPRELARRIRVEAARCENNVSENNEEQTFEFP